MFARIHMLDATPEQQEVGLRVLHDEVLPWLRDSTGFRGVLRLTDPEGGKTITMTLWATEQDLRDSAGAAERIASLTASGIGATRQPISEYEVTLLELPR